MYRHTSSPYKLSENNCVSGKRVSQIANVPAAGEDEKLDRVLAVRLRLQNSPFKCADVCNRIVDRDRYRLLLHRRRRTEDHPSPRPIRSNSNRKSYDGNAQSSREPEPSLVFSEFHHVRLHIKTPKSKGASLLEQIMKDPTKAT